MSWTARVRVERDLPMNQTQGTRRDFLRQTARASLFLGAGWTFAAGSGDTSGRPNLVVIFTDDQTYRAIGYNNPVVRTPVLDGLAREGIIFDHAYEATPICVASRASIMTGRFPQQHGAIALDSTGFQHNVVETGRMKTVAHYLAEAGYTTAFCGKSHLGDPKSYGFLWGSEQRDYNDIDTFAAAKEFVEGNAGDAQPFFLWVAPRQPHVPLVPEQQWLDLYKDTEFEVDANFLETPPQESLYNQGLPGEHFYRDSDFTQNYKDLPSGPPRTEGMIQDYMKAYYATISHLDHQIGEFVEQMKHAGVYDNTIIVFLSDNGYHLGNHGLGNKITMHEESVRVPMFMHGACLPTKRIRSGALVSSVDMLPTLLALAETEAPGNTPGISLLPVLTDPTHRHREYVVSECVGVGGVAGTGHRMVRTARWKYVLTDVDEEALFDESSDPFEQHNLAGDPQFDATRNLMRDYLREWMDMVGDAHTRPPV